MEPLYSPQSRAERLIAAGRVVLAVSSLFAIWFDPSEPAKYARIAYSLLVAYVVYSTAIALFVWRSDAPPDRLRLLTQGIDLAFFSLFIYFTSGPASPFVTYFVFAMVCATLRWHWRGTLWTALASLAAFLGVWIYFSEVVQDPAFELYPLIVRSVYLAVVAVLLGYLGAHEQQTRRDMSLLAAWPHEASPEVQPLARALLEHAARALGAPRVLLLWIEREEPWLYLASWSGAAFGWSRESPEALGELVAVPLREAGFLCPDASRSQPEVLARLDSRLERWRGTPLDPVLRERFAVRSVLALPVRGEALEGRLLALDKRGMTSDDLVLGEIVAGLVGSRLDHFYLDQRLQETVATEERIRLARDLHDGVLQSLTGIGLRVAAMRLQTGDPQAVQEGLAALQRLLVLEQQDLRFFIQELKPPPLRPPGEALDLEQRIAELAQRVELEWGLSTELRTEGLEGTVPEPVAREVYHVVREALVNAVRHGEASAVRLEIVRRPGGELAISVADNGRGFPFQGRYSHAALTAGRLGPRTLLERVDSLAGTLTLESSDAGARLDIRLPVGAGA